MVLTYLFWCVHKLCIQKLWDVDNLQLSQSTFLEGFWIVMLMMGSCWSNGQLFMQPQPKKPLTTLNLTTYISPFSKMVLFMRSARPFYWGVYLTVLCVAMLSFWQNELKSFDRNSSPLSVLNFFTFLYVWVLTKIFNSLNFRKVSLLFLRK